MELGGALVKKPMGSFVYATDAMEEILYIIYLYIYPFDLFLSRETVRIAHIEA